VITVLKTIAPEREKKIVEFSLTIPEATIQHTTSRTSLAIKSCEAVSGAHSENWPFFRF
jgi:hypothetical protein